MSGGVKLDVATTIRLSTNGVGVADLQRIEVAINKTAESQDALANSAEAPKTGTITNQDVHIIQIAAMLKTGVHMTNIIDYLSQCGIKIDSATIFNLEDAGVTRMTIQILEQSNLNEVSSITNRFANLYLASVTNLNLAAVTNLSIAATNVPMAQTSLPVLAE